jgi:hypothetical protein
VRQCTAFDLCIPKVDVAATDDEDTARWKGHPDRLVDLEQFALDAIRPPLDEVAVPVGARTHRFAADEVAAWLDVAKAGIVPVNQRRQRVRVLAERELRRRSGGDEAWRQAAPLKAALSKAWPTQQPAKLVDRLLLAAGHGPGGRRRSWTSADQYLIDEANTLLNGTPFVYGHVVVDEAQDHSAVALRVIGRRTPAGSCTLVGDVAQSTTPAGQESWEDVFEHLGSSGVIADLTIGYRVPEPILSVANRLLPMTGVDATESRSVRRDGDPPGTRLVDGSALLTEVAEAVAEVKHRHRLTGVVAPSELHADLGVALATAGFVMVDHVHELARNEVPVFSAETVKGLEFDGVVVVEPHVILGDSKRGARLMYVAMTRAVQELMFVSTEPLPDVLTS